MDFPRQELKRWFIETKRSFPWRENPAPYPVWVSEVMLQQTQAKVVVPYFERWMKRFPTLQDLAKAPIEEVIKLWEGLGYYSRARNLHEGAKYIVGVLGGKFPETEEKLLQIKGIGSYTAGALLNFAFRKKAPAIDGNVYRVLTRYYGIEEPIDELATQRKIRELTIHLLPEEEPWIVSEALIECGATLCQKNPLCEKCPLMKGCVGFREGIAKVLPKKKKSVKTTPLFRIVAVIEWEGEFLIKKGERGKVMGELYEFPFVQTSELEEGILHLEKLLDAPLTYHSKLAQVEHSFTRFRATLFPHRFSLQKRNIPGYLWVKDLNAYPFSSGHRRIAQQLVKTA